MTEYYDKEMENLEQQQRELADKMQRKDRDRYNTEEKQVDIHDYKKIVNAQHKLAPESAETLEHYIQKIEIFQKIAADANWDTHVDNSYRTWHTHKLPSCFMCADTQFIGVLVQVLKVINSTHKDISF